MGLVPEKLQLETLKAWITSAFSEVGVSSVAALRDDKKIEKAASLAYRRLPLVPVRATVKATIGESGFARLIFAVRDRLLELQTLDLSQVNTNDLKTPQGQAKHK